MARCRVFLHVSLHSRRSKYFKGKKIFADYDIRIEQVL